MRYSPRSGTCEGSSVVSRPAGTIGHGLCLKVAAMNFRLLMIPCAIAILAGCASTPVPLSQAKPIDPAWALAFQEPIAGESAKLVAVRDASSLGAGCFYALSINRTLAARLDVAERVESELPVGEHVLRYGRDPMGQGLCATMLDTWTQPCGLAKRRSFV